MGCESLANCRLGLFLRSLAVGHSGNGNVIAFRASDLLRGTAWKQQRPLRPYHLVSSRALTGVSAMASSTLEIERVPCLSDNYGAVMKNTSEEQSRTS